MKKITTLLFAVAFMAISANASVTINVRTTTGDAPYLYTWGGASNGEWPGTLMDETQTSVTEDGLVWLTQEFDCDAINIIFNDGGLDDEGTGAIQTDNILGVTGTAYFIFDPEEGEFEDVTGTYVEIHEFDPSTLPAGVVFVEGKEFAYFVAPTTWTKCNVWAWNSTTETNFTEAGPNGWPGDPITLIGNTTDGNPVYQWIGPDIVADDRPEGIIFNNGSGTQTSDLDYVAGGVYNLAGKLLYTVSNNAGGGIELLEPVITDNYIEFVGVKASGNYKFTLNTYEWEEDHGPQFQLTIEPIDPSKPAFFAAEDLNDPNYWEPMFMRVTQEMAGQSMTAQDNIKRLYLGDVQLLENQFIDYDELHVVGFNQNNNYTLPAGCLLNAGQHMDEMDVKCNGSMTLSPNSLPVDKNFVVTVYTQQIYDVWNAYKQSYNCQYILNLVGDEPIPGDVDGDGHVTSGDVTALYNYMLNSDDSSIVNGDQDGDGHITSGDVTTVYNLMLGN